MAQAHELAGSELPSRVANLELLRVIGGFWQATVKGIPLVPLDSTCSELPMQQSVRDRMLYPVWVLSRLVLMTVVITNAFATGPAAIS